MEAVSLCPTDVSRAETLERWRDVCIGRHPKAVMLAHTSVGKARANSQSFRSGKHGVR